MIAALLTRMSAYRPRRASASSTASQPSTVPRSAATNFTSTLCSLESAGDRGERRLVARNKKKGVARAGELLGQRPSDPCVAPVTTTRARPVQLSC